MKKQGPRQDKATGDSRNLLQALGLPADISRLSLSHPALYHNRELGLLEFNERVLSLARNPRTPLLERLRFLTISTSNLDEFFEIRVSGLKEHIALAVPLTDPEKLTPRALLGQVSDRAHRLVEEQYRVLNEEILPALQEEGIVLLRRQEWSESQRAWVRDYFVEEVMPVLTPVGLDPAHPFPRIVNKSLNFIVSVKGKDAFGRRSGAAVVQAPRLLPRIIALPPEEGDDTLRFVPLTSVIHANVEALFPGMKVRGCHQFRVTRNSDLWVDEEEIDDLLLALEGKLDHRRFAGAARLEVADSSSEEMQQFLLKQFHLSELDLYRVNGPVNLHRLSQIYDLIDRPDLKYPPYRPGIPERVQKHPDIFTAISKGDILLHPPFESYSPVIELLQQAARDPKVLAIRQMLYRTEEDSLLVEALCEAALAGKEVTAVVELRARFDEAANIRLATRLQEVGAKVVYGIVGFKTHAKMMLVVRREKNGLRRYVHLGTGNYHAGNARAYTDFGLLTSDRKIGEDVHSLFQQLTGLGKVPRLRRLVQAPFSLYEEIIELIESEIRAAEEGRPARIIAKMNSLIEPQVIQALYRASQAGVSIDLIVRGMCALRPGIPGLSDNIRVRSILGRFLEHSRVYFFHADGEEKTFCSSADWMPRNFFRRVECCFPVSSRKLRRRVIEEGLMTYLCDNTDAWNLLADGTYEKISPEKEKPHSAQIFLLELLQDEGPTS